MINYVKKTFFTDRQIDYPKLHYSILILCDIKTLKFMILKKKKENFTNVDIIIKF